MLAKRFAVSVVCSLLLIAATTSPGRTDDALGRDRGLPAGAALPGALDEPSGAGLFTPDVWPEAPPARHVWRECAPPVREDHSLVYDSRRDCFYVVGGRPYLYPTTIWRLDVRPSVAWSPLDPANEGPDHPVSAAYDPVHDRLLVYGRHGPDAYTYGLWQLTLSKRPQWSVLIEPGGGFPSSDGKAIALDAERQLLYLHHRERLFRIDLASPVTWGELATTGTYYPATEAHRAAFDARRNRLYVRGLYDVYALDLATPTPTWSTLPVLVDEMDIDAAADELVGIDIERGVFALDLGTGTQRQIAGSSGGRRQRLAVAIDPVERRLLRHGGWYWATYSDLGAIALDGSPQWQGIGPTTGGVRVRPAAVIDETRDRLVIFGGTTSYIPGQPDLIVRPLDGALGSAESVHVAPGPRPGAQRDRAIFHDRTRDRFIVFARQDELDAQGIDNGVWVLSMSSSPPAWTLVATSGPRPEGGPAWYDSRNDRLLVVGTALWVLQLGDELAWRRIELTGSTEALVTVRAAMARAEATGERGSSGAFFDARALKVYLLTSDFSFIEIELKGDVATVRRPEVEGWWPHVSPLMKLYDEKGKRFIGFERLVVGTPQSDGDHSAFVSLELSPRPHWLRHPITGPVPLPRESDLVVLDEKRERLLVIGGFNAADRIYDDAYMLSLAGLGRSRQEMRVEAAAGAAEERGEALALTVARAVVSGPLDVAFTAPGSGPLTLEVIDVTGRRVARRDATLSAGRRSAVVRLAESGALSPGVYFVRLQRGAQAAIQRVVVLR